MDAEVEQENEVTNDRTETTIVFSNETENPSIGVNGNETEGVPTEVAPSDDGHIKPATDLSLEQDRENELHDASSVATGEHVNVEVSEQRREDVVDSEISGSEGRGLPRLQSPQTETTTPALEGEEAFSAGPVEGEHISHEEYTQLHQELCEERDKALQRSSHLQVKLSEYLRKKAEDDTQPQRVQEAEPLQAYETCMSILTELRQQLATESEAVAQQAELLRAQAREQLSEVENEWQALMTLKQDVAVTVLSRSLGKQSAEEKVASTLSAEQLRQDQLIKARTKLIMLRAKIDRLETALRTVDKSDRDPLQIWFKQLQAERLKQKRHIEKQSEESLKLQRKISSDLELLSNVKEKLYWSQTEVQAKREQLADVEAVVALKRDLLTRTKQARDSLQRDNQRLKERRGLLGNKVLLRDFEDTVDAVNQLEEQLENLKSRQAEIIFGYNRSKNPETA